MTRQHLSQDTEVVLLLCGRFGGEREEVHQPLTPREYGELAKWLKARSLRPSTLMTSSGRSELSGVQDAHLEQGRLGFLLDRGTAMALALERWARGGLWVISRSDAEYPKRLWRHFKHVAPPLLYGAGNKALLETGGLAIIGSRDASETALAYTKSIAAKCAIDGLTVVSGGARGVDIASMQGVTEAGGSSIGVLGSDLLKTSLNRQNRIGLQEGRLALVSPYFPEAAFSTGTAMGRNRYIYTLADQALVIDSGFESGGTWAGAIENLKNDWVPLYVRMPADGQGNEGLVAQGAVPFTLHSDSADSLVEFFASRVVEVAMADADTDASPEILRPENLTQSSALASQALAQNHAKEPEAQIHELQASALQSTSVEIPSLPVRAKASEFEESKLPSVSDEVHTLDMYADFSPKLQLFLATGPRSDEEISAALRIERSQGKAWLKRAVEAGFVEKKKKSALYTLGGQGRLY